MSDVVETSDDDQPRDEIVIIVLDEPIKVYPYHLEKECVRAWTLDQYPLNTFTLKARNSGSSDMNSYFNLNVAGPLILHMSIKITKFNFDPIKQTKLVNASREEKELKISINEQHFDWHFTKAVNAYNEDGSAHRVLPFWLKVECSIPKSRQPVLNGSRIEGVYLTDISEFFDDPAYCDFQFRVEKQVFHVSKLALAIVSPVFKTMFASNLLESQENFVEIEDFSATIVKKMLEFVYNNSVKLEDNLEQSEQLVAAADKYQIDQLKERCENIILKHLNIENAARLVVFADNHQCILLRQACIALICANYAEFIKSQECKELHKNFTELAIEISGVAATQKS